MKKEGFLQVSFAWLFAVIVGAVILFLAIYGVTRLVTQEETIQSAKTSKEIGILLNPLETGFEEARSSSLTFPVDTRIYNRCKTDSAFGRQLISVSQKSFNKWTQTNIDVGFSNKYILSENPVEGKKMLIFSKPFNFPYKVSDLIYITSSSDKYCFVDAPSDIEDEIKNIGQENLLAEDCEDLESIKVCFSGGTDCDVDVNYGAKWVKKHGETMYFEEDALMFAAIFSDRNVYECQLKRLMARVSSLASLYRDKENLISRANCGNLLDADLLALINMANGLDSSINLASMRTLIDDINSKNKQNSLCKLW